MVGSFERGNEPSSFITFREFLDSVKRYWLVKKDSAPGSWNQYYPILHSDSYKDTTLRHKK